MKTLKYLMCAVLTFSMVAQSFAATAIEIIRETHELRQTAYNGRKAAARQVIPGYTNTINGILQSKPSDKTATKNEIGTILKAIMAKSLIHGNHTNYRIAAARAKSDAAAGPSREDKHHRIISLAEQLSDAYAEYFQNEFDQEILVGTINSLNDIEPNKSAIAEITRYNPYITGDLFAGLFAQVLLGHAGGFQTEARKELRAFQAPDEKTGGGGGFRSGGGGGAVMQPARETYLTAHEGKKLTKFKVRGDGRCGYYAIGIDPEEFAVRLGQWFGTGFVTRTAKERELDKLISTAITELPQVSRTFGGLLASINTKDVYATSEIINIISRLYKINIEIFTVQEDKRLVNNSPDYTFKNGPATSTVRLLHSNHWNESSHFDLLLGDDADPSEKARAVALEDISKAVLTDFSAEKDLIFAKQQRELSAARTELYDVRAYAMNAEGGGNPAHASHSSSAGGGGLPVHAFSFSAGGGGGDSRHSGGRGDVPQTPHSLLRATYAVGLAEHPTTNIDQLQGTFDMTSLSKRESWGHQPYKEFLFGNSKPKENYGLMTTFSFYLTYLDWSRQQRHSTTPGFLGLQHGLPYNTMSPADIARFKSDAEAAFGNGYVSYTGIVKPDAVGQAEHFWALLAIKGEQNQIKALYLLNPTHNKDRIRDNEPSDNSYVKIILKLRSGKLPIDNNRSFFVGVQGGSMACGLAATMIARYFSTLKASDIATDEKVLAQIMALKKSCGYGVDPLQKLTSVDKKLIIDETKFGNAIVGIFDELYEITSGGLSFPQTVKQWLAMNSNAVLPAVIEGRNAAQPLARAAYGGASAGGGGGGGGASAGGGGGGGMWQQRRAAAEQAVVRQILTAHLSQSKEELEHSLASNVLPMRASSAASAKPARADDWPYTYIMRNGDIDVQNNTNVKESTDTERLQKYYEGAIGDCREKTKGMIYRFSGEENIPTGATLKQFAIERAIQSVYKTPTAVRNPALDAELKKWLLANNRDA